MLLFDILHIGMGNCIEIMKLWKLNIVTDFIHSKADAWRLRPETGTTQQIISPLLQEVLGKSSGTLQLTRGRF